MDKFRKIIPASKFSCVKFSRNTDNSSITDDVQLQIQFLNNGTSQSSSQNNKTNGDLKQDGESLKNGGCSNGLRTVTLSHLPVRQPVDIEFLYVHYAVSQGFRKSKKIILKGITGKFSSGQLTAIMGPSGAGKSTLMNVLTGYKTTGLRGHILINGEPRKLSRFRKLCCFIMQHDCLLPNLTVREAMMVSANLKLGKDTSQAAKRIVVDEIIDTLGLVECSNTMTLHLSGGQRKRLSIALELVNNPPVMFFDEPTSGLDSSTCFQLICLLKSLARGGRTIVCTIHQPSARLFEMFDHLYMLVRGQCIYQGAVDGLVPFLAVMGYQCPSYHNPADYFMEVASEEHGRSIEKLTWAMCNVEENAFINEKLEALIDHEEGVAKVFPTSGWQQFWILLKRTFLTIMRDQTLTQLRLVSHVVVGILIGLIYYDIGDEASEVMSNAGCVFFTTMFTMFTAMMPTILTFPTEMAVFVREHLNNWYSLRAFYVAKTIADLPFQVVFTSGYVLVVYYMTSQPLEPQRVLMFVSICILTALVAQSLGLLIGAAMKIETGMYIGPITTIPIVLFSGFFVNFDTIPSYLSWLTYASYMRYGFEGAMCSVYGFNRKPLSCTVTQCAFTEPEDFLKTMSMDKTEYWIDASILVGFFVSLRLIAYAVLKLKLISIR